MQILPLPDHVVIDGLEFHASRLAEDAARATAEAEALVISLLRGDDAWRGAAERDREPKRRVAGAA